MNSIIRKFNQNRKTIILYVFIAIVIIIAIRVVNNVFKEQNQAKKQNITTTNTTVQNISKPNSSNTVVTEGSVPQDLNQENTKIIEDFIEACNSENIDMAYELISDECKNQTFPTKQYFIEYYYKKFFNTKKDYDYQSWVTKGNRYTYKIKLYEKDIMATGGQNISAIEEYYTVVRKNNELKLNINNYIGTTNLNIQKDTEIGTISVNKRITFMEYEIYEIEFKNKTNNNMLIDSKEKTSTMYLTDKNNNKYSSYSHEIADDKLWIKPYQTTKVEIKYAKQYANTLELKTMEFSDIILNYNEYRQIDNKNNYTNRYKISIDL